MMDIVEKVRVTLRIANNLYIQMNRHELQMLLNRINDLDKLLKEAQAEADNWRELYDKCREREVRHGHP
jgi:hypothetical protein